MSDDIQLLIRLKQKLGNSQKLELSSFSRSCQISEEDLFDYILRWRKKYHLAVKIEEPYLLIEDLTSITQVIEKLQEDSNVKIEKTAYVAPQREYFEANEQISTPDTELEALETPIVLGNNDGITIESYHGVSIIQHDRIILQNLENETGTIPYVNRLEWNTLGFCQENNRISKLGLYQKNLTSIPDELGNLDALQILYLRNNHLNSLPVSIGKLRYLHGLDLRNNSFDMIPDQVFKLEQLEYLDLDGNQLKILPDDIDRLKNLQIFELGGNRLGLLPEAVGTLIHLKKLNISLNELTNIPESLCNLTELQHLVISENSLSTIPECLGNFTNLMILDARNNQFTQIPDSLGNLSKLREIYLQNNEITQIPESFENLHSIKRMNLYNNRLHDLSDKVEDILSNFRSHGVKVIL